MTMLVILYANATHEQMTEVLEKIEKLGYKSHVNPGVNRTVINVLQV